MDDIERVAWRQKHYPAPRNPVGRPKGVTYKVQRHMIDGTRGPGNPGKTTVSAAEREQYALIAMADYATKGTLKSGKQLLLEFANDESIPQALRISAAMAHAKYEPAYLPSEVQYPNLQTVEQAEAFKQELIQREGRKELDSDTASIALERVDNIIADNRADQVSTRADAELELKRLAADVSDQPQIIKISGGLPELPGTHITMPTLNGHQGPELAPPTQGPVIEHQPAKDPEP
jgi:hypothetical protein